eukprot:EG_transcript_6382
MGLARRPLPWVGVVCAALCLLVACHPYDSGLSLWRAAALWRAHVANAPAVLSLAPTAGWHADGGVVTYLNRRPPRGELQASQVTLRNVERPAPRLTSSGRSPTLSTIISEQSIYAARAALFPQIAALFDLLPVGTIAVGPFSLQNTTVQPINLGDRLQIRFQQNKGLILSASEVDAVARGVCVAPGVAGPYELRIPQAHIQVLLGFVEQPLLKFRIVSFDFDFAPGAATFRMAGSPPAALLGDVINAARRQLYPALAAQLRVQMASSVLVVLNRQLPDARESTALVPGTPLRLRYAFAAPAVEVRDGTLRLNVWADMAAWPSPPPSPDSPADLRVSAAMWQQDPYAKVAMAPQLLQSAAQALFDSRVLELAFSSRPAGDPRDARPGGAGGFGLPAVEELLQGFSLPGPAQLEVLMTVLTVPRLDIRGAALQGRCAAAFEISATALGQEVSLARVEGLISVTVGLSVRDNALHISLFRAEISDLEVKRTFAPMPLPSPKAMEQTLNALLAMNLEVLQAVLPQNVPLVMLAPLRLGQGVVRCSDGLMVIAAELALPFGLLKP